MEWHFLGRTAVFEIILMKFYKSSFELLPMQLSQHSCMEVWYNGYEIRIICCYLKVFWSWSIFSLRDADTNGVRICPIFKYFFKNLAFIERNRIEVLSSLSSVNHIYHCRDTFSLSFVLLKKLSLMDKKVCKSVETI